MGRKAGFAVAVGVVLVALICVDAKGDANSIGPNGVNATVTGLTGAGQVIGQLEPGRPASALVDTNANVNGFVTPTGLFTATPTNGFVNFSQSNHAEEVAGTMISTGFATQGISNSAKLYSADDLDNSTYANNANDDFYRNDVLPLQKLAQVAGMRAINMSYGLGLPNTAGHGAFGTAGATLDGTSGFTRAVDWTASRYNVLPITAGNETGNAFGLDVPTDSFNGIVVGATSLAGGAYTQMSAFNVVNQLPTNGRRTIDIVAPGDGLTLAALGTGNTAVNAGTSFSTPHVTGAVALIDQQAAARGFTADAFQHQVSKAVLLNSADKVQGILGMDHTILRGTVATDNTGGTDNTGAGLNWLQERAAEVTAGVNRYGIPLDSQLGVGQLNVRRAQEQINAGEQKPGNVGYIGWDYNAVQGGTTSRTYALPPIQKGQYISATLTWDRAVVLNDTLKANNTFDAEAYIHVNGAGTPTGGVNNAFVAGDPLTDVNGNNTFDNITESFSTPAGSNTGGLNDLDLFILPHGDTNLADAIGFSNSSIYSLEQVFFQVPNTVTTTNFDIEVLARDLTENGAGTTTQTYGLAWWTAVPEPSTLMIAGPALLLMARRRPAAG